MVFEVSGQYKGNLSVIIGEYLLDDQMRLSVTRIPSEKEAEAVAEVERPGFSRMAHIYKGVSESFSSLVWKMINKQNLTHKEIRCNREKLDSLILKEIAATA